MAGFFDGEGCIKFTVDPRNGYEGIELDIRQTTPEPLQLYAELFGGTVYRNSQVRGKLPSWAYRTNRGDRVGAILSTLMPYLIVKREKGLQALQFLADRRGIETEYNEEICSEDIILYCAGFFDAEGSVSVRLRCDAQCPQGRLTPQVRLTQTVVEPLVLFQKQFDGYVKLQNVTTQKGSPIYHYMLKSSQIPYFCETIEPHLIVKRKVVRLLQQMHSIRLNNGGGDPRFAEKLRLSQEIILSNCNKGNKSKSIVLQMIA